MRRWKTGFYSAAVLLLAGCASNLSAVGDDQSDFAGTLILEWVQPQAIEIQLDGETYTGAWTNRLCTTDACRGKFRNVRKIYRRHIHHGEADLTAINGARMHCEWVSYLPEVDGQCRTQDGRLYRLREGNSASVSSVSSRPAAAGQTFSEAVTQSCTRL